MLSVVHSISSLHNVHQLQQQSIKGLLLNYTIASINTLLLQTIPYLQQSSLQRSNVGWLGVYL